MIPRIFLFLLISKLGCSVTVIDRFDWGAGEAVGSIPIMDRITDIVIGDDGETMGESCSSEESCKASLQWLQRQDQAAGYADLRYHFYVSSEGTVFEGRGWGQQGDFTDPYADYALGIGYLGDFSTGMTDGAESAIQDLIKNGYQSGKIVSDFCLMFTCDLASLQQDVLQGPSCPEAETYNNLATWEPLPEVRPKFVYRPCGCGKLELPSNGAVQYTTYDIGTAATYTCTDGYELIGESTRTCESSGAWSDVSFNPPQCVDPSKGLIIVPKRIWDSVVPLSKKDFIEEGFPVATFFVDIADGYCVNDRDCREKLLTLKEAASNQGESDVLCNFYIAKTGIVYEGRGWGVKGGYMEDIRRTQGICFLGLDAIKENVATDTLFKLIAEAQKMKILGYDFCFLNKCPLMADQFCQKVRSWNMRVDRPTHSNKYCEPDDVPEDNRAPAKVCRHKKTFDSWRNYEGTQAKAASGCPCLNWSDQSSTQHHFYPEVYPYADLRENFCRNPDQSDDGPWCITDPSCGSAHESCKIPQCAPAASFGESSGLQYELDRSRATLADKLTMTFKPNKASARLIKIMGGGVGQENFWDVRVDEGVLRLSMQLTLGADTLQLINLTFPDTPITVGQSNELQILRKNRRVLVLVNGVEQRYIHPLNRTIGDELWFIAPQKYIMGYYISDKNVFSGCMADVKFNRDDIVGVATKTAAEAGSIIIEGISDDGCLSVEPFDWSGVDFLTTPPPPTQKPTTTDKPPVTDPVTEKKNKNLPIIIVIIIILLLLIILLIVCLVIKRRNKDKGVYKVDEATTTKWDWKLGILPVLSGADSKSRKGAKSVTYDPLAVTNGATAPGETGEVFA